LNTPSSCCSWLLRASSAAASEALVAASRVRNSLCARVTVVTSTPLPKKPAPVCWLNDVASSTLWRE
jgi:hypothetical protein